MTLRFEVGGSVTLAGNDLQFTGVDGDARIKFLITGDALKRLAKAPKDLTRQEKFKVYDRNRAWLQELGRSLYERARPGTKTIKIGVLDV